MTRVLLFFASKVLKYPQYICGLFDLFCKCHRPSHTIYNSHFIKFFSLALIVENIHEWPANTVYQLYVITRWVLVHSSFEGLKLRSVGREFQFLEVMGTTVLENEVVRYFSNLTVKGCWESAKRLLSPKQPLGGNNLV